MAVFGEENTKYADLKVMLEHTRAVRKGAPGTLVVGDMPFGSYEESDLQAVETAKQFTEYAGADAVKLEGGGEVSVSRINAIIKTDIPVMGHIGLLPQTALETGGYRVIKADERERMLREAAALQDAGAFAVVLESIEEDIGREITELLDIPTIGIGAGRYTDGQILVINDILGLSGDFRPKFVKKYIALDSIISEVLKDYSDEVRSGIFPAIGNTYSSREKK